VVTNGSKSPNERVQSNKSHQGVKGGWHGKMITEENRSRSRAHQSSLISNAQHHRGRERGNILKRVRESECTRQSTMQDGTDPNQTTFPISNEEPFSHPSDSAALTGSSRNILLNVRRPKGRREENKALERRRTNRSSSASCYRICCRTCCHACCSCNRSCCRSCSRSGARSCRW